MHPAIQSAKADAPPAQRRGRRCPRSVRSHLDHHASHNHDVMPCCPRGRSSAKIRSSPTRPISALGAAMTTTWGTSIAPNVGLSRVHQRVGRRAVYRGHDRSLAADARGLAVTQPLLRGAGTVGAASAIAAARLARDAAERTASSAPAEAQVYLTLVAYFELVAGCKDLALLRAAEGVAQKVVDDTKALVEGQQRPRSDLRGLEGNLANRTRAVIEAENNRLQAALRARARDGARRRGRRGTSGRPTDFPSARRPRPTATPSFAWRAAIAATLVAARKTVASRPRSSKARKGTHCPASISARRWATRAAVDRRRRRSVLRGSGKERSRRQRRRRALAWSCRSATPRAMPIAT